jgi:hypothetical protein
LKLLNDFPPRITARNNFHSQIFRPWSRSLKASRCVEIDRFPNRVEIRRHYRKIDIKAFSKACEIKIAQLRGFNYAPEPRPMGIISNHRNLSDPRFTFRAFCFFLAENDPLVRLA